MNGNRTKYIKEESAGIMREAESSDSARKPGALGLTAVTMVDGVLSRQLSGEKAAAGGQVEAEKFPNTPSARTRPD